MSKSNCPVQKQTAIPSSQITWPPGPEQRYLGWGLLKQLRHDLLGSFENWQRTYGKVVHIKIWPEHEVILTEPSLVRELLVTQHASLIRWEHAIQIFSQIDGQSVLTTEGQIWKQKRTALQATFSLQNSQCLIPQIVAATEQALAQAKAEQQTIERLMTSVTMEVMTRLLFSSNLSREDMRLAEQAVQTALLHANAELYWFMPQPAWLPWKRDKRWALNYLNQLIDQQIQARLALPEEDWPEDLLAQLLALHQQDPSNWPLSAVHDECMTLFLAGHETTAATLIWWVACLATHPELQDQARAEVEQVLAHQAPSSATLNQLAFVHQTLKETMRLYPAAPVLITRRSTQALALGTWQFPKSTLFIVPVYLMQRDPEVFPNPLAFQPERFKSASTVTRSANLPFGIGPRVCLGQHLATTEMLVIASLVLQRFKLVLSQPLPLTAIAAEFNISLRPKQPLPVRLEPLNP